MVTAQLGVSFSEGTGIQPEKSEAGLQREFWADDHRYWGNGKENSDSQQQRERWQEIRGKMQTEVEIFSKEAVREAKNLVEAIQVANRSHYDYRNFLKKFSVLKEEMQVDMDSFDYIFYHYGMEVYGNMPLIEPLETRETQKIEDFVTGLRYIYVLQRRSNTTFLGGDLRYFVSDGEFYTESESEGDSMR
mgnify:CR=1 FL=1